MEDPPPYHTGTAALEPPLTTEDLVALAHARHQGIPYETSEQLLARLPERLLGGKMHVGDVAYAVAALIDSIEHAPAGADRQCH